MLEREDSQRNVLTKQDKSIKLELICFVLVIFLVLTSSYTYTKAFFNLYNIQNIMFLLSTAIFSNNVFI